MTTIIIIQKTKIPILKHQRRMEKLILEFGWSLHNRFFLFNQITFTLRLKQRKVEQMEIINWFDGAPNNRNKHLLFYKKSGILTARALYLLFIPLCFEEKRGNPLDWGRKYVETSSPDVHRRFLYKAMPKGTNGPLYFSIAVWMLFLFFCRGNLSPSFFEWKKPVIIMNRCYIHKQIKHLSLSLPNEALSLNPEIDSGHNRDHWSIKRTIAAVCRVNVKVNMHNFASLLVSGTWTCSISPEMKLSLLSKESLLPNGCQVPSRFWQDSRQVPGRGEPRLRLKPIHRRRKRLSGGKYSAGATQQSFPSTPPYLKQSAAGWKGKNERSERRWNPWETGACFSNTGSTVTKAAF